MLKFIDLFSGMGGFRIGFEKACQDLNIQCKCVFSSEIKQHALDLYNSHFNETNKHNDITTVNQAEIPEHDILLGGFPCQAFSSAGKRLGFEDLRGTLFFYIAKILKEKKPTAFILENVEGLINHDSGKTFKTILTTLETLDYNVSFQVLNSADFGTAQDRKRIYIVGNSVNKDFCFSKGENSSFTLNSILEK